MGAGCVYMKTHTKDMEQLGGLIKTMPKTAICFLFAAVAICAFPPLNGFVSEFLMYAGLFDILTINSSTLFILSILAIASLALVGTLVILAMTKVYSITFLGLPRSEHASKVESDVPKTMLFPMGILAALTIIIGLFSPIFSLLAPAGIFTKENLMGIYPDLFIVSLFAFVLFTTILIFSMFLVRKNKRNYETWGCGYDKGNNHIQYTASSFVSPFTSILTPLFKRIFDVKKPKGFFPTEAHYESSVEDVEEAYIINPILKFDEKFLSKFERLQDGNIQHYILYGLIFLILMLIGVVFVG
jgi:NADH:ubiquinone oxidoreductase subunit 5 (subunit L)/multisubunit Na+/H+ antiporter MnhA subunit